MSALDDLYAQIPIAQLAERLGVDQETAGRAVRQALPALVGGMQANAQDPAGAASLTNALAQHADAPIDQGVDLDRVDTHDGQKIVGNVFGDNTDQVMRALGGGGGGNSGLVSKLLPLLAPLVLAWLGKRLSGAGGGTSAQQPSAQGGGGLGDLLGGLLGGSGGGAGGLGDLLGGLLGAGKR